METSKREELNNLILKENLFLMDDTLFAFMGMKRMLEYSLSGICILYNSLLLLFLIKTKEFRTWMFFPMMLRVAIASIHYIHFAREKAHKKSGKRTYEIV